MTAGYERGLRRDFVGFISLGSEDSFIEFGCGSGNFLEIVSTHCREAHGLDASRQMLARAELRLRRAGVHNVQFTCSSVENFKPTRSYDWAVAVAFLYLFQNPVEILQKMKTSIRPGGSVANMDPSAAFTSTSVRSFIRQNKLSLKERYVLRDWLRAAKFYHRFNDVKLKELYAAAGLESVQLKHTLNGMVVFAKGKRPAL